MADDDHGRQDAGLAQCLSDGAPRLDLHHRVYVSPVKVHLHAISS